MASSRQLFWLVELLLDVHLFYMVFGMDTRYAGELGFDSLLRHFFQQLKPTLSFARVPLWPNSSPPPPYVHKTGGQSGGWTTLGGQTLGGENTHESMYT